MVENTNRIFMYRDSRGSYQLLRTEMVPNKATVHLLCTTKDVVQMKCQGSKFKMPGKMSCTNLLKSTIRKVNDRSCPAQMYSVGYAIAGQHLEVFRACYDLATARAIFAESDIYYRTFCTCCYQFTTKFRINSNTYIVFFSTDAKRPLVEFVSDGLQTMGPSYIKKSIYEAFCSLLNNCKDYIPNDKALMINRGHLVASADFFFVDQMISTYRYINVVPQFKSINEGNWQKIESWVRSKVPSTGSYRVKTGGIDVLALRNANGKAQHIYLAGKKLPVPQWIYKTVKDDKNKAKYVFLFFNSIYKKDGKPRAHESCKPIKCPVQFPNNAADGYYYCCDPATFRY